MAGPTGNAITAVPAATAMIAGKLPPTTLWYQWFQSIKRVLSPGISATVALAPTTSGGTVGSLTVVNGIVTSYIPPT